MTWTLLGEGRTLNNESYVKCKCSCGVVRWVRQRDVNSGRTKSCGCERGINVSLSKGGTATPRSPVGWYVMMLDGSNIRTRWAQGKPDDTNPWYPSVMEPPREAIRFDTQELAQRWVDDRIVYRALNNRPVGQMYVREL